MALYCDECRRKIGKQMELNNQQAAAMRQRLASAERMRDRLEDGSMDDRSFRSQIDIISGKRSNPKKKAKAKVREPAYGGSENDPNLRAKLRLPELDSTTETRTVNPGARQFMKTKNVFGPEKRMTEWAAENGLYEGRNVPTEFDYDAYWTRKIEDRLGIKFHHSGGYGASEVRAVTSLGEDISSGSGAGAAIVGQLWGHTVMDLIRQKTFLNRVNVSTMVMKNELVNMPVFQADVQPSYISENSNAMSIDVTPNLGTIQFNAAGAFADITNVSINILEDAVTNGGVDAIIQNSIAQKYARLVDQVAIYGQAGSAGNPGWVNEAGLLSYSMGTNGAVPSNYQALSKATALIRAQGAEPNGFIAHPQTVAEYGQLVDTLGQPMRPTPDIERILPFVDSGLLNYATETQGSSAVTSSILVADWSYTTIGWRVQGPQVSVLTERFADFLEVGFLSRSRFSIRTYWPTKASCRIVGVL